MKKLQYIKDALKQLAGNGYLYFDHPCEVKISNFQTIHLWGAALSPLGSVFLSPEPSNSDQWYKLEDTDKSYDKVVNALYDYLSRVILTQYKNYKQTA